MVKTHKCSAVEFDEYIGSRRVPILLRSREDNIFAIHVCGVLYNLPNCPFCGAKFADIPEDKS